MYVVISTISLQPKDPALQDLRSSMYGASAYKYASSRYPVILSYRRVPGLPSNVSSAQFSFASRFEVTRPSYHDEVLSSAGARPTPPKSQLPRKPLGRGENTLWEGGTSPYKGKKIPPAHPPVYLLSPGVGRSRIPGLSRRGARRLWLALSPIN